jgi:hypothetical protein
MTVTPLLELKHAVSTLRTLKAAQMFPMVHLQSISQVGKKEEGIMLGWHAG